MVLLWYYCGIAVVLHKYTSQRAAERAPLTASTAHSEHRSQRAASPLTARLHEQGPLRMAPAVGREHPWMLLVSTMLFVDVELGVGKSPVGLGHAQPLGGEVQNGHHTRP